MFNQPTPSDSSAEKPVLYLGDTALDSAAAYLAGMLALHGYGFDYVASETVPDTAILAIPRKLFILSDFKSSLLDSNAQATILGQVRSGSGLLMIGGWESFCGLGGEWSGTPVAEALPVVIAETDDRVNCDQVALLAVATEHPILAGLPWGERPPAIGGFNRFMIKAPSELLLSVVRHRASRDAGGFHFATDETDPLLVVGKYGLGRTAALATDLAPHWVGPLVDWGTENAPDPSGSGRLQAQAPGAEAVEVGVFYARFVRQLLSWTGRLDG
jgi:hypothetical protein